MQTQVLFEGFEVAVVVQQLVAGSDAKGGDKRVDRVENRESKPAQCAVILRRGDGQFRTACLKDGEPIERFHGLSKLRFAPNSL